jgi:hypothetical protein
MKHLTKSRHRHVAASGQFPLGKTASRKPFIIISMQVTENRPKAAIPHGISGANRAHGRKHSNHTKPRDISTRFGDS